MSNPRNTDSTTGAVDGCLERLRNGDPQARLDLFEIAARRLTLLAQRPWLLERRYDQRKAS